MPLLERGGMQREQARNSNSLSHFPLKNHSSLSDSILYLLWVKVFFDISYISHWSLSENTVFTLP